MIRPITITLALAAVAHAADQAAVNFPEPQPVGFAGTELAVPVRIENRGEAAMDAKFSTRLWQMSSATLVPLGEAVPWWEGRIEAGKSADAIAKIALPDFRSATRLRLQVLAADGSPAGKVDVTAIPRDWLRGEIAALPAPPTLYDPGSRIASAFAKLGIETVPVREAADLANVRASLVVIVSPQEQIESLTAAAQRLVARGVGVAFIQTVETTAKDAMILAPGTDLADSAPAQFRLVQSLREALKRKQTPTPTSP